MSEKYPIGLRVFLPAVEGKVIPDSEFVMHQPKPEAVGMYGTLTAYEDVELFGRKSQTPVITLDNGELIRGYECWWKPAEQQPKEA